MSMISIGQAVAHWKQVSHLSVARLVVEQQQPAAVMWRDVLDVLGVLDGDLGLEEAGAKVWTMPMAMPQPGHSAKVLTLASELLDDQDRAGRDEDVEQRDLDQPLPGEAHQLVDAHARQRAPHPHEDEHEREHLGDEPEEADHDLERHERTERDGADRDHVEQHEARRSATSGTTSRS